MFTHPGTLAAEDDSWLNYLLAKFPNPKVTITGYGSGVAAFLAKPDYSQQCFVTSEPLLAKRDGGDPQTFLIADAGYNPYTTVLITRGDTIRDHPDQVKAIVEACREGWHQYLDDPSAANIVMGKLNTEMDADTFKQAAAAQEPLIDTGSTPVGSMSADRWRDFAKQLVQLKVIDEGRRPSSALSTWTSCRKSRGNDGMGQRNVCPTGAFIYACAAMRRHRTIPA